ECLGPVTTAALAEFLALAESKVEAALLRLESEGIVLRGTFTGAVDSRQSRAVDSQQSIVDSGKIQESDYQLSTIDCRLSLDRLSLEWCERRLLARIHRMTVGRLRKEIEAVSVADFVRFLLRWQHVQPGAQLHKRDGVAQVIGQLQGLELPAPAWERD